jgi:hypothetical protein
VLVVVLGADLPAPELPSFIESVHGIEGGHWGIELDVDHAILVALVELDTLNSATKLNSVSICTLTTTY